MDIDISGAREGVLIEEIGGKKCITINPEILLVYGVDELLPEMLSFKAISKNATTLNSIVNSKEIYGLLSPTEVNITTSKESNEDDVITDVLEKITWRNPEPNLSYVSKYEVIINYKTYDYKFYTTQTFLMMPTTGTGEEGDVEFGAGEYTIKLRALTDDSEKYVNSKFCESIKVTILETPNKPTIVDGDVAWTQDMNAGYYLVKVYVLDGDERTAIVSTQVNISSIDLTKLIPMGKDVYGVTVQAMHDNLKILSSKESEMLKVVRLPQVNSYKIDDGELYINVHKFYVRAEVYVVDKDGQTVDTLKLQNQNFGEYETYVEDNGFDKVINTYEDKNSYIYEKYLLDDDSTLRKLLSNQYSLRVKLFGGTFENEGIVSSVESSPINNYLKDAEDGVNKNIVEKLLTPEVIISPTERGVVLINSDKNTKYSLQYYVNDGNVLQGVHLYKITISTSRFEQEGEGGIVEQKSSHIMYIANITDIDMLFASLTAGINSDKDGFTNLITAEYDINGIKNFAYNGITFNVIDVNDDGYMPFDFNTENEKYYYYDEKGICQVIDLSKGGSFMFEARFIGDDSIFVNSNVSASVEIKRYNVINLEVVNGDLAWLNQAQFIDDNPIYIIELTNTRIDENYNIVLYNPATHSLKEIQNCLDSTKTYIFDEINYFASEEAMDATIVYSRLADIIGQQREGVIETTGANTVFSAKISAHFTDMTTNNIILAQEGSPTTITVVPNAPISIVNGEISWKMSSVETTESVDGNKLITDYLLQAYQGEDKMYEIILTQGQYSVNSSNIATYKLPIDWILNNGAGTTFQLQPNSQYEFKLIALGSDNKGYVNSSSTATDTITMLPDIEGLQMQGGVLVWSNSAYVELQITYTIKIGEETSEIVLEKTVNGSKFNLPSIMTDTSNTDRNMVHGYDYYISARLKGASDSISGKFIKINTPITRLKTVDVQSIVSNEGVVNWEASALEGATYSIKYTHTYLNADGEEITETGMIENLDTPSYDFAGFSAGTISVEIFAHHNSHFSAFTSGVNSDNELPTFIKLSIPTNIQKHNDSTTITWDNIDGADGYMINVKSDDTDIGTFYSDKNSWDIENVPATSFSISVKAISKATNTFILNGEYTNYLDLTLPNQVDATKFRFDQTRQAFIWKAIEGEQADMDKYYIGFTYYNRVLQQGESAEPTIIDSFEVTQTITIDGEKYYCYKPYMIGSYRLIYVQVMRMGSLASQRTWCMQDGDYYGLDFNLFAAGSGESNNPYEIHNEEQLRNIKYFLNANYKLMFDIELDYLTTNAEGKVVFNPITTADQVFSGNINGNSKSIIGKSDNIEVKFNESGYVGLFSVVKGATFTNLTLTNFNINGYLKSTLASNPYQFNKAEFYLGILVGRAEGELDETLTTSKFNYISIIQSTIRLAKYDYNVDKVKGCATNSINMYIGGIVGYAVNCEFDNCIVSLGGEGENLITQMFVGTQTKLGIGGIAGYANNCELTNNKSSNTDETGNAFVWRLKASYDDGRPDQFVGALVGEGIQLKMSNNKAQYLIYGENESKTNQIGENLK